MASKRAKPDRGQVLAAVVEASGMKKEEVASRAGYSRSAYYKHIENPHLDYHILMAYGKVLNHDFTETFPDMPHYELEDPEMIYFREAKTFEEAMMQKEYWKNKYLDQLEKNNELLEKYTALLEDKAGRDKTGS
jgi:hypothetical protein